MAEHAALASAINTIGKNCVSAADSDIMSKHQPRLKADLAMNLMHFNISGQRFIVSSQLVDKFPRSNFTSLAFLEEHWIEDLGVYYFDRDPALFNTVLNIFRYNVLNVPSGYDRNLVMEEVNFWNVSLDTLSTVRDQEEARLEAEFEWLENRIPPPPPSSKRWIKLRYKAWCLMTDPLGPHTPYRKLSMACCVLTVFFTLLFLIMFGLSTSVYYRQPADSETIEAFSNNATDMDMEKATAAIGCTSMARIDCYLKSKPRTWVLIAINVIIAMFILETVIRLILCPGLAYFKSLINWMDIFTGVCALIIAALNQAEHTYGETWSLETCRKVQYAVIMMQSFQVLRVFKIFQYASVIDGLMIMVLTIKACLKELLLLVIYLLIAMFIFSTLIFFAELGADTGTGIPDAIYGYWWSIITMTTVGYGDFYPTTTGGYIIGVMCSITGIILTALPVAVIGSNFNTYWEHNKKRRSALIASINDEENKKQSHAFDSESYSNH